MRLNLKYLVFVGSLMIAVPAMAVEGVMSPDVNKGLLDIESLGKYQNDNGNKALNGKTELQFGVNYGVTDRWRVKNDAIVNQTPDNNFVFRSYKFGNVYQLTKIKNGSYLDLALYNTATFAARDENPNDVSLGFLARKDFGDFLHTANLYVRKDWGSHSVPGMNVVYRWQTRYTAMQELQPGIDVFGDTQKHDSFSQQTLSMGPLIYGLFHLDDNEAISYELVYLFGATTATPDGALLWKVKYGVQF